MLPRVPLCLEDLRKTFLVLFPDQATDVTAATMQNHVRLALDGLAQPDGTRLDRDAFERAMLETLHERLGELTQAH